MRVVVSGGGTGGHIMPAIAIAEALGQRQPGVEVLFIGGASGMETEIVPKYGIPFHAVTSRKLRKVASVETIGVLLSLLKGFREARTAIKAYHADVVVGTGGYAAAATVLAGASAGLPTLIHEGNVIAGRTNRLLARSARRICVTFAETVSQFSPGKAIRTGLPLRPTIVAPSAVTSEEASCRFPGLVAGRFTLFVTGGSQGARAINKAVLETASALLADNVQILHHTGTRNFADVQQQAQERGLWGREGYCPLAFLDAEQMPLAYRAADILVCRGGVSTLAEALVNTVPALIVPLPTAYADHQTFNARALEVAGAAIHLPEREMSADALQNSVLTLRNDPDRRTRMMAACKALGTLDAAETVATEIVNLVP